MKKTRTTKTNWIRATLLSLLVLTSSQACAQERKVVKIDGSSTVFPVTEAVAEEFQKSKKGSVQVTVGISGTGGGFKKFCRGELDVADASRPILTEEIQACKTQNIQYLELPICFDALTVAVNPKNSWASTITVAELKKLWEPAAQGTVMKWSQVRAGWPDQNVKLFGAGSDSGTFDYFTEAVVGKAKSIRGDYTGSEDDNTLVQGIASDPNALGFLPYAYFQPNQAKLKAVPVDAGKGAVPPSAENVLKGTYAPLSRPLFIYVNAKALDKPEVKEFVEFYLKNVGTLSTQVKYLPLPSTAYTLVQERVQKKQVGSAFGGVPEVGLHVEDLLKRVPKL